MAAAFIAAVGEGWLLAGGQPTAAHRRVSMALHHEPEHIRDELVQRAADVISGSGVSRPMHHSSDDEALGSDFTTYKQVLDRVPMPLPEEATTKMLESVSFVDHYSATHPPVRGVFCTRSLDLNQIKVIGYDMDYTLVDYKMELWEERAYYYSKELLESKGFPVVGLTFNPELVTRGLIIDKSRGNLLKVDKFGFVRRAMHGLRHLSKRELQHQYGRVPVDLRESRWAFLNTLFSVSEGVLYAQLVDRLDSGGQMSVVCHIPHPQASTAWGRNPVIPPHRRRAVAGFQATV